MAGELQQPSGGTDPTRLRISDSERHQVAEILREAAGEGRLDIDELDQRLEATYAARTYADLVPITLDLPAHPHQRPVVKPAAASPDVVPGADRESHFAILSGLSRKGVWVVPKQMTILAMMGGAELDLRRAKFAAPEVVITINAFMGGAQVIVGPSTRVQMEGTGIMGGYSGPSGSGGRHPRRELTRGAHQGLCHLGRRQRGAQAPVGLRLRRLSSVAAARCCRAAAGSSAGSPGRGASHASVDEAASASRTCRAASRPCSRTGCATVVRSKKAASSWSSMPMHRHVLGDPEVELSGGAQHPDRHLVGRGEDRGRSVGADQQLPARRRSRRPAVNAPSTSRLGSYGSPAAASEAR